MNKFCMNCKCDISDNEIWQNYGNTWQTYEHSNVLDCVRALGDKLERMETYAQEQRERE